MSHANKNKKQRIQDVKKFISQTSNSTKIVDGILYESLERATVTREGSDVKIPLKILVVNGDTLTVAQEYGATCILSMASPYNRGGGVFRGATSQEEGLCARTNLYSTLEKYANIRLPDQGGIYSPIVNVLRNEDLTPIINPQFNVSIISCAAIKNPETTTENRLNEKDVELTLQKMKFILRCADKYVHPQPQQP